MTHPLFSLGPRSLGPVHLNQTQHRHNQTLLKAAQTGNLALAKAAIKKGADVNHFGFTNMQTPLRIAVRHHHEEMITLLLKQDIQNPFILYGAIEDAFLIQRQDLATAIYKQCSANNKAWVLKSFISPYSLKHAQVLHDLDPGIGQLVLEEARGMENGYIVRVLEGFLNPTE